jgi:hypothetical protein
MRFLPTITVFPDGSSEEADFYDDDLKNPYRHYRIFACMFLHNANAKFGTVVLYHHRKISENGWTDHCLDYLLKKTKEGWQPYVSSYDIDDDRPLEYDINIETDIGRWLKAQREEKEIIMKDVEARLS